MNLRTKTSISGGGFPLRGALGALAMGALLPLAGCNVDSLLRVDDPDVAPPGSIEDPQVAPTIHAGVLYDFQRAFVGTGATSGGSTGEGQALVSGMFSDELYIADSFTTRHAISRRGIATPGQQGTTTNSQVAFAERQLHRSRRSAENAVDWYDTHGFTDDPRVAEALALAGFTYVFAAENYCEGMAFSQQPRLGGPIEYGQPLSRNATLGVAIERFDQAVARPGGASAASTQNRLARVGRARALVNRGSAGDLAAAAALVADIPTSFAYRVFFSDNSAAQENPFFHYAQLSGRYAVPNRLGVNGIPWLERENAGDPRVQTMARPAFSSALGSVRVQSKYDERTTAVILASGVEARLIEAEAALAGGASADYLPILNALRADLPVLRLHTNRPDFPTALPALTDPGTAAARVDQFFEERALWLWLTGHRLGDMRRLVRQYGRAVNTVFPVGNHGWYQPVTNAFVGAAGGGTFGSDVNLPLHVDETNNPHFTGCLNRDA